jgi:hypothetical protein
MKRRIGPKKDPDFLDETGSFTYPQLNLPRFSMGPRNGSENKELHLELKSQMSILKKE